MKTVDILLTRILVNMLKMSINVVKTDVANLQITGFFVLIIKLIQMTSIKWKVLNKLISFFLASQMLLNCFRPSGWLLFCLAINSVSAFTDVLGELTSEFGRYAHSAKRVAGRFLFVCDDFVVRFLFEGLWNYLGNLK